MNEVSLALVPATHPIIAPSTLEPEALGLLDRLLSVFQEEQRYGTRHLLIDRDTDLFSDALLITATLNCIGILIRMRPAISGRILNAILRFNPFTLADKPLTPRTRVMMKSIERTVRAFFMNLIKRCVLSRRRIMLPAKSCIVRLVILCNPGFKHTSNRCNSAVLRCSTIVGSVRHQSSLPMASTTRRDADWTRRYRRQRPQCSDHNKGPYRSHVFSLSPRSQIKLLTSPISTLHRRSQIRL